MNKKEQSILLNQYKDIYYSHMVIKIDKFDSMREFRHLLKNLGLIKELHQVENNILSELLELKSTVKEMYNMIFEDFAKHNIYVNYDLKEIDTYYEDLQFEFTAEQNKCHKARINYITENIN